MPTERKEVPLSLSFRPERPCAFLKVALVFPLVSIVYVSVYAKGKNFGVAYFDPIDQELFHCLYDECTFTSMCFF